MEFSSQHLVTVLHNKTRLPKWSRRLIIDFAGQYVTVARKGPDFRKDGNDCNVWSLLVHPIVAARHNKTRLPKWSRRLIIDFAGQYVMVARKGPDFRKDGNDCNVRSLLVHPIVAA